MEFCLALPKLVNFGLLVHREQLDFCLLSVIDECQVLVNSLGRCLVHDFLLFLVIRALLGYLLDREAHGSSGQRQGPARKIA